MGMTYGGDFKKNKIHEILCVDWGSRGQKNKLFALSTVFSTLVQI